MSDVAIAHNYLAACQAWQESTNDQPIYLPIDRPLRQPLHLPVSLINLAVCYGR